MATVQGTFEFLQWQNSYTQQKPYEVLLPLSSFANRNIPRSNLVFEPHSVPVHNVRGQEGHFTLDTHGFQFFRWPTSVQDLRDKQLVLQRYIPEMEGLLRAHLGTSGEVVRTFCFDLRMRKSIDTEEFSKKTVNLEDGFDALLPATHPHIDQSIQGAVSGVRRHMGDEADDMLKKRVRIVNIWRPLDKVASWPLAVCDARTVIPDDLVTCDIVRRRYVGETYFGKYNPDQRWHFLPDMERDEVALLKIYDSDTAVSAQRCLHSSFPLKDTTRQGQAMRESIELRILVFTDS